MREGLPAALLCLALCTGCSGDRGIRCEGSDLYAGAGSVAPIRVPDDLSLPDESEALSIPTAPSDVLEEDLTAESCLESPPDFYEEELG